MRLVWQKKYLTPNGNVESCRQLKSVDWALLNRRHLKPPKTTTAKPQTKDCKSVDSSLQIRRLNTAKPQTLHEMQSMGLCLGISGYSTLQNHLVLEFEYRCTKLQNPPDTRHHKRLNTHSSLHTAKPPFKWLLLSKQFPLCLSYHQSK